MRPEFLLCIILFIQSPGFILASNEIQYSSEYVDPAGGKTPDEIWELAAVSNPDIQIANRKIFEAQAFRRQAAVIPNPELEISGSTSSILGEAGDREWITALVQPIELGGKRSKRIRVADLTIEIAKQEVREKERQIRWELNQAITDLLSVAATTQTTEEALTLNEKSHEITLARVEQGESAAVERSVSEVELSRLRTDLAALKAEGARRLARLQILMGLKQDLKIRPVPVPRAKNSDVSLQRLVAIALSSRPDLQLATLQVALSRAELSLAKAEGISDLDAFVEFSNERSSFDQFGVDSSGNPIPLVDADKNLTAGISIRLPIFNRNQGNTKAAEVRSQSAEIRKASLESVIRMEVETAFERYRIAQSNFVIFRDSILNQSEKQLAVLQASYRAGELRFFDLINEQKRALEIRKSYISSAREYLNAIAELEFVTGADMTGGIQ